MTCIVGLVHKNKVYMGGDSAGYDSGSYHMMVRKDRKVFKICENNVIIGFTSSFRMGQILQHHLKVELPKPGADLFEWMVTVFVEKTRDVLGRYGYKTVTNSQEIGGTFLVGVGGRLFYVDGDFQVGIPHLPYWSVGCGRCEALGSMFTSEETETDPKQRILTALGAAAMFSGGVAKPFFSMSGAERPGKKK